MLGRFIALYGEKFPDDYDIEIPETEALTRALYRQSGASGYLNRRSRRYQAEKALTAQS
jgi:hypothetical protein